MVYIFGVLRSEEHTSELQSLTNLVCRLLLGKTGSCVAEDCVGGELWSCGLFVGGASGVCAGTGPDATANTTAQISHRILFFRTSALSINIAFPRFRVLRP